MTLTIAEISALIDAASVRLEDLGTDEAEIAAALESAFNKLLRERTRRQKR